MSSVWLQEVAYNRAFAEGSSPPHTAALLAREARIFMQPIHALPEPSDEIHAVKKQREVFVGFLFMAEGDGCVLCRELAVEFI